MNIKEKIKNTGLFQNIEKIELLASIDSFSPETIESLSNVIDEYDESLKEMKSQFNNEVGDELEKLKTQTEDVATKEALDKIKTGYAKVLA
ncbi:hypothetical protein KBD45_02535 [Candidatus Dojkabacteria bacterium]|nr:hypothetical protein [Candidatus Dojkabacteria bacterium]